MHKNLLTYALDSSNKLKHVDAVENGMACGCVCPCCREKLMAKNGGTKRMHHFAHASGVDCEGAYETMLHLLAKERIQDAFMKHDTFNIEYAYRSYCRKVKECTFFRYGDCYDASRKIFNLKNYYDSCEQELPYDTIKRRSDLKIFSKSNPNLKPVYIEFFVTHASEIEKLHSGEKIIEIKIESEEDIDNIVAHGFIETTRITPEVEQGYYPKIEFYGFKYKDYKVELNSRIQFVRYLLDQSGKSSCYRDSCLCGELLKTSKSTLCEICFHTTDSFKIDEMVKYQGLKKFGIKNCRYCKNYVRSYSGMGMICKLYKYLGILNIDSFDTARAKECPCFTINEAEMQAELKHFDEMTPNSYTELE